MDRRQFISVATAAGLAAALGDWEKLFAMGRTDPTVGKALAAWKKGQFQVHFIYTGASESMFLIFPDGTSMLLDCGEQDTDAIGVRRVPRLPDRSRLAGEWVARYVQRVNPRGRDVDYMMLSHYHGDHAGCETVYSYEDDVVPYRLSGFGEAARYLRFGKAFDRCWPDCSTPKRQENDQTRVMSQMCKFYEYQTAHNGMSVERFEVGATDQIRLLHRPSAYPDFHIRNLCGNGCVAAEDGTVTDLYAAQKRKGMGVPENALSLGMIISYGPFRYYTAGDFSGLQKLEDGTKIELETQLAPFVEPCQVAKLNHHGHKSMPRELVGALRSRVWINCTWRQNHCTDDTLERLLDRNLYPGDRVVCPGMMPPERRRQMEELGTAPLLTDVAQESFEGGHVVLTVEKGGRKYSVAYLTAADESMTVRSVLHFMS